MQKSDSPGWGLLTRGHSPYSLTVVASEACVHGFNGTVAKTKVLNWLFLQGLLVQREQTETPIFPSLPPKEVYLHPLQVAV